MHFYTTIRGPFSLFSAALFAWIGIGSQVALAEESGGPDDVAVARCAVAVASASSVAEEEIALDSSCACPDLAADVVEQIAGNLERAMGQELIPSRPGYYAVAQCALLAIPNSLIEGRPSPEFFDARCTKDVLAKVKKIRSSSACTSVSDDLE